MEENNILFHNNRVREKTFREELVKLNCVKNNTQHIIHSHNTSDDKLRDVYGNIAICQNIVKHIAEDKALYICFYRMCTERSLFYI